MNRKMKVGLYFGSFNPVHIGHMAIANYMVEQTDLKQIWFVVSPQSPFKRRKSLLEDNHRLELLYRAIGDDDRFRVSDIEFRMPKPSFTTDTLAWLTEKHPKNEFVLIMGSDQLPMFPKWKNSDQIVLHHSRYIYPRPGHNFLKDEQKNILVVDAPLIQISASFIRKSIREGKDVRHFLPPAVWEYLDEMNFYRN
jgi:nicotinate-nucleotide adenylyltransferase